MRDFEVMTAVNVLRKPLGALTALVISVSLLAGPAGALEADKDEKQRLEACEKTLCETVVKKSPTDGDVACDLTKTWDRTNIKKGAGSKSLSWGFGDAKCRLEVNLPRKHLVAALTEKKHKFFLPRHTVVCDVETDKGVEPVRVTLQPKMKFENGKAEKVELKVEKVEGPAVLKGLIWTTVKLEDNLGIFHKDMVKQINKFLLRKCPKRHG